MNSILEKEKLFFSLCISVKLVIVFLFAGREESVEGFFYF